MLRSTLKDKVRGSAGSYATPSSYTYLDLPQLYHTHIGKGYVYSFPTRRASDLGESQQHAQVHSEGQGEGQCWQLRHPQLLHLPGLATAIPHTYRQGLCIICVMLPG